MPASRPPKFHGLRHTFASHLLKSNVHPKLVQHQLGHHDPAFTLRVYSHFMPGVNRQAADAMDALLGRAKEASDGKAPEDV